MSDLPPVSKIEDFMRTEPVICGLKFDRCMFLDEAFNNHPVWITCITGTGCVCAGTLAIVVDIDKVAMHHTPDFYAKLSDDTTWSRLAATEGCNIQGLRRHVDFSLRVMTSNIDNEIHTMNQTLEKRQSERRLLLSILERDDPR